MFFKGFQYIIQAFGLHSITLILGVIFVNLIKIGLSCFVSLIIIGIGWALGFCIVDYGN